MFPQIEMFDYDEDGDRDLFMLAFNNSGPPLSQYNYFPMKLYRNDGGYFTDATTGSGLGLGTNHGFFNLWDYNGDGFIDIVMGTTDTVFNSGPTNRVYKNNGNGTFTDVSGVLNIFSGIGYYRGVTTYDVDNNGYEDAYYTSDNKHYQNNGNSTFSYAGNSGITAGISLAGDYNRDGKIDFITGDGNVHVSFNQGPNTNNWVEFKLVGCNNNRSTLGAKVTVQAGGKSYYRIVKNNYNNATWVCSEDLTLHFGLKNATSITSCSVKWPNGEVTNHDVNINSFNILYQNLSCDPNAVSIDCFTSPDGVDDNVGSYPVGWSYKDFTVPAGQILDSIYIDAARPGAELRYYDLTFSVLQGGSLVPLINYDDYNYSLYNIWFPTVGYNLSDVTVRVALPTNAGSIWNSVCFATSPFCEPIESRLDATITRGEVYDFNGLSITSAGTYEAIVVNSAGCDSIVTLILNVIQPPIPCSVVASSEVICKGEIVTLTYQSDLQSNLASADSAALWQIGYHIGPFQPYTTNPNCTVHTESKWVVINGATDLELFTLQHRYYDRSRIYSSSNTLLWEWGGESVPQTTWYGRHHSITIPANDSIRIEFYSGYPGFCVGGLAITGLTNTHPSGLLWSTGATSPSITVAPTQTTTYAGRSNVHKRCNHYRKPTHVICC
jgi:hypothetical protein